MIKNRMIINVQPQKAERMERVISADGTRIAFYKSGEGTPLLLVHGALGDHTRWDVLKPYLEPHFTVYAMDRRGRGASGDTPDYDVQREFEDVAAVVDAISHNRSSAVDVVGSSAGASFAIAAAGLTKNIRKLILFEPPTHHVLELLPSELLEHLNAMLEARDREGILTTAYRKIVGLSDTEIEQLRSHPVWPNRVAAAHTIPRELSIPFERMFNPKQAARVSVPALLLVGEVTPEPFKKSADTVASALPNARTIVFEGHGHGTEMFAAKLVADAILTFLRDSR